MKFMQRWQKKLWNIGISNQTPFKVKRRRVIDKSNLKRISKDLHEVYPVYHKSLTDLMLPNVHEFILMPTMYKQNISKPPCADSTNKVLPTYKITDEPTDSFVRTHINPYVCGYNVDPNMLYVLQAIFDSPEWRTMVFYMVSLNVPDTQTLVHIHNKESNELIVEKRGRYSTKRSVNLGRQVLHIVESFRNTERKKATDLQCIRDATLNIYLENDTALDFVLQFKTSIPIIRDVDGMKDEYSKCLHSVVSHKLVLI